MKLKRVIIAILAFAMILSMGQAVAFADEADDTITVGILTAPTTFDMLLYGTPTQMQMCFEGLFDLDPVTGEIVPWLAESYEWVGDDSTTMRVKLRDDVYFSNGAKLTAEDVIYSYKRHVDNAGNQKANYEVFDFEKTVAEDDLTILFVTTAPTPSLLFNMSKFTDIVCKEFYENLDDTALWDQTCGTGPYAVEENVSGDHTTFVLREDYWNKDRMPQVKRLVLQTCTEESAMLANLKNGDYDMILGLDDSNTQKLQNGEVEGATVIVQPTFAVDYLCFPEYVSYYQDVKVRQAIAHAVDWAVVADNAYGSLGTAPTSVLPSSMTAYYKDEGTYEYDPELAKQLLAEAGYPDGFTINSMAPSIPQIMTMYETVQYYLSEVGITLNYQPGEMSAVMPAVAMADPSIEFFILQCNSTSAVPDPTAVLEHQRADAMLGGLKITDEEYNQHYQAFINSSDEAARQEEMNWIQDWFKENCWVIPTAEKQMSYAFGPKIKAAYITSDMMAELRFIELN